jgi:beta propeller repeat protein
MLDLVSWNGDNSMKKDLFFLATFILVFFLLTGTPFPGIVSAQEIQANGTETLITTGTSGSSQSLPAIAGSRIVWVDMRNPSAEIYLYDVSTGTETRLTNYSSSKTLPAINQSGTGIVWQDDRNGPGPYDIFLYDIGSGTERQITTDGSDHQNPHISGTRIVWEDSRSGNDYDVWMFDTSTGDETPINVTVSSSPTYLYPAINQSGTGIIWVDPDDGQIYLNDTVSGLEKRITNNTSSKWYPKISDDRIVWQDSRNGKYDIYMFNTSTGQETRITNDSANYGAHDHKYPAINESGTGIVYVDERQGPANPDLFLYDTVAETEYQITTNHPSGLESPAISGNRIVWDDSRNGDPDVFLFTLGQVETCPVASFTRDIFTGPAPQTVHFTDTTSGLVTGWFWNFSDGGTSNLQNPTHVFTANKGYDVTLTVNNSLCRNATKCVDCITLGRPVASFTTNITEGFVPLSVQFKNTSTGSSMSLAWDFDNNGIDDSTQTNPVYIYNTRGIYTVKLNASNLYGHTNAQKTITVVNGTGQSLNTSVTGIDIQDIGGKQFLTFDTTVLTDYSLNATGNSLRFTMPPNPNLKNVTFFSTDGLGFVQNGTLISGNISTSVIESAHLIPADFTAETGAQSSVNYALNLTGYPLNAKVNTTIWEDDLPADHTDFWKATTLGGFASMDIAYSFDVTGVGVDTSGPVVLNFSLNSTWITNHTGYSIGLVRLAHTPEGDYYGEILPGQFACNDTTNNLTYFTTISQRGLSKFGVAALSGSGNVFQMVYLAVAAHFAGVQSSSDTSEGPVAGTGKGTTQGLTSQQNQPLAPAPASPAAPEAKSVELFINDQAVVTQTTILQSVDQLATLSIGQGVVAKDSAGSPLSSVTIETMPDSGIPETPQGSTFSFAGIAYNLQPDGATFSPATTITFSVPQAQWSQHYTIKEYDMVAQAWVDLPTTYHPESGTISASVSHFCIIALFSDTIKPSQTPSPTVVQTPVPTIAPPQSTSPFSIFYGMVVWLADVFMKNMYLFLIVAAIAVAFYVNRRRKGRDPIRFK